MPDRNSITNKKETYKMKNTLLVDGNFLLKKSYEGNTETYGVNGKHIGGLVTFMNILRKRINEHQIDKVFVAWDGENSGLKRYKLNRHYKANRKNKEWYVGIELSEAEIKRDKEKYFSMLSQKIRIQNYLEHLHIRQIEIKEVEGDDILAHYVKKYANNENILIYTNDRDYCQLLEYENTEIFIDNLKTIINKKNFKNFFPFSFNNALMVKVLCGDNADNLKGIKGLTDKKEAKTLLKLYPELKENKKLELSDVFSIAEKNKTKPIYSTILDSIELLEMNYKIMNLSEPFLTEDDKEEIENVAELPLDCEDRKSESLLSLMTEDGFLSSYNSDFLSYIKPFFNVIITEKAMYNENNIKK